MRKTRECESLTSEANKKATRWSQFYLAGVCDELRTKNINTHRNESSPPLGSELNPLADCVQCSKGTALRLSVSLGRWNHLVSHLDHSCLEYLGDQATTIKEGFLEARRVARELAWPLARITVLDASSRAAPTWNSRPISHMSSTPSTNRLRRLSLNSKSLSSKKIAFIKVTWRLPWLTPVEASVSGCIAIALEVPGQRLP